MGLPEYRRAGAGQLVVKGGGVAILLNLLVHIVLLISLVGLLKDLHGMGRSVGVRGHLVAVDDDEYPVLRCLRLWTCYVDKLRDVENLQAVE